MSTHTHTNGHGTVTRSDIVAKLDEIRGVTDTSAASAQDAAKPVAMVAGVLVLVVAYLFGRRRGRKRRTFVEIRRV
jgi:MYXO-CTERM domain-containing protein